jgi:hypothetical protein
VTLVGETSGPVSGSLVVDRSNTAITFVKTGEQLAVDTYTVTLRSAPDGFITADASLLDGDDDGTAGGDYVGTFSVAAIPATAVAVNLPDFVRGPGQGVAVPADIGTGIPISISDGTEVRTVTLSIRYDPNLLDFTGATLGPDVPALASLTFINATPGLVTLEFVSPTALPTGIVNLVNLQAMVPVGASDDLGRGQLLDVHSVTVTDGLGAEIPALADDAIHLVAYFGDVSGNRRINATDAAQVARVAALIDGGFASVPLLDPEIVGDISGNRRVNAGDASLVARAAALIDVPQIPTIAAGIGAAVLAIPNALRSLSADLPQAIVKNSSPLQHGDPSVGTETGFAKTANHV